MLVTLLALLVVVVLVGWLLLGPRPTSAPAPLTAEHEVRGLPRDAVARWVWAHRPGLSVPGVASVILLGSAGFLVGDGENIAEGDDADLAWLAVAGLAAGIVVLVGWAHFRFRVPPFIRVLREQPELVVWAYRTDVHRVNDRGIETGVTTTQCASRMGAFGGCRPSRWRWSCVCRR